MFHSLDVLCVNAFLAHFRLQTDMKDWLEQKEFILSLVEIMRERAIVMDYRQLRSVHEHTTTPSPVNKQQRINPKKPSLPIEKLEPPMEAHIHTFSKTRSTCKYCSYLKFDRIPSNTPGAEPPRDARDSGSARSHSTHLETSSSDRPKWSPTRSSTRYQDQISVTCTRWTLRMPSFTRATHAQPSLSNFPRRDSNFGERTRSRGTTLGERNFPTSPQNKKTKLTHCSIYVPMRTISTFHTK